MIDRGERDRRLGRGSTRLRERDPDLAARSTPLTRGATRPSPRAA